MKFLPLPKKVYKYRSIQSALRILENQSIYLPSASKFNDPFDCKIPMNFEEMSNNEGLQRKFAEKFLIDKNIVGKEKNDVIDKIIANGKIGDINNLRQMEKARLEKMEEVFGVFCLSVIPDNLLMWSHYADSHTGICIGFNSKKLIDIIEPTWVAPIQYSFEYPQISILEHPEKTLEVLLFNKSIDWHYEKEIRYVKNTIDGGCEIKIPVDVIEEIYLGCLISSDEEQLLTEIISMKYPKTKVIRYKKNKSTFKLEEY